VEGPFALRKAQQIRRVIQNLVASLGVTASSRIC
jgi:hypothetical protein